MKKSFKGEAFSEIITIFTIKSRKETSKYENQRKTNKGLIFMQQNNIFCKERKVREMKKMINNVIDTYNAVTGSIVAVLSYILGEHWILFVAFLALNIADWLTGWMKASMAGKENSGAGWKGVLKKLGYWIMIMVAFGASAVFVEIGKVIGVDLGVTTLLGWFVLASLLINEIRSIVENFVEAGFNVPAVLVKGLEVADKVVNKDQEEE